MGGSAFGKGCPCSSPFSSMGPSTRPDRARRARVRPERTRISKLASASRTDCIATGAARVGHRPDKSGLARNLAGQAAAGLSSHSIEMMVVLTISALALALRVLRPLDIFGNFTGCHERRSVGTASDGSWVGTRAVRALPGYKRVHTVTAARLSASFISAKLVLQQSSMSLYAATPPR
jgi:hypothetical protein